jgi:hypothetical protein
MQPQISMKLQIDRKLCFVLMPFGDTRPIYETIRRVVEGEHSLRCQRADDIYSDGVIMEEIWAQIHSAHLLIADATGRNPNVFYEVGLAHGIGKHVVILTQDLTDVPFDLKHRRIIAYDRRDLESLRMPLSATVSQLKWQPPHIACWIPTDHQAIRIGLAAPTPGAKFSGSPIEACGRVVGLPLDGLDHSIEAFVRTDRLYRQTAGALDQDGFWRIDQIHLGGRTHLLFFEIWDEAGRMLARSEEIPLLREARL